MDEARKLDIAQIAATEYARRPSDNYSSETFGKQVAKVFKDAYEALGDKQEEAVDLRSGDKYYNNSDQSAILSAIRRKSYAASSPTFADYAKVTTQVKQDTFAAWKDLEAAKIAKYNEKVKASEQAIAQKYGMSDYEQARDRPDLVKQDDPKWTEHPKINGVYFIDCPFSSMQARWVLVCLGFVSWFGDARSIHYTSSGITRFYGPMKAPE